jgi:hypothetical protein
LWEESSGTKNRATYVAQAGVLCFPPVYDACFFPNLTFEILAGEKKTGQTV